MTEQEKNVQAARRLQEMSWALTLIFALIILLVAIFQWLSVGFETRLVEYIDLAEGVLVATMIMSLAVIVQPKGSWLRRCFKYLHQKIWVEWC